MQYGLYPGVISLVITALVLPFFICFMKMKKEGQQIREEGPKWHAKKAGTPTMGGIVFLLSSIIATVAILLSNGKLNKIAIILIIAYLGYGLIGFLDDGLKLLFHRNLGLRAWQKLLGQIIIALVILLIAYSDNFTFKIYIPLFGTVNSYLLFVFFIIIWLVGYSNAVNLSDGLDGLATGLSIISYGTYAYLAYLAHNATVLALCCSVIGGLVAFLIFNHKPAKIFMGDVGSLALGGGLAAVSIFLNRPWSLLIIGIVYVLETLSVILQVISFQTTGKRIFKMTPIHHHFEMLGWSEWKVDIVFWLVGLLGSIIYLLLAL